MAVAAPQSRRRAGHWSGRRCRLIGFLSTGEPLLRAARLDWGMRADITIRALASAILVEGARAVASCGDDDANADRAANREAQLTEVIQ
jgi:hypothetical protein